MGINLNLSQSLNQSQNQNLSSKDNNINKIISKLTTITTTTKITLSGSRMYIIFITKSLIIPMHVKNSISLPIFKTIFIKINPLHLT